MGALRYLKNLTDKLTAMVCKQNQNAFRREQLYGYVIDVKRHMQYQTSNGKQR